MDDGAFDRRTLLRTAGISALTLLAAGCGFSDLLEGAPEEDGRLDMTLLGSSITRRSRHGVLALGVADDRDALFYVPRRAVERRRVPLIVNLHGAGGGPEAALRRYREAVARAGVALLVPGSRGHTWDAVLGAFGPDVDVIQRSLDAASRVVAVDPERIAIAGYADGASYALTLGLTNGDVFTHVIANSPGSIPFPDPHGRPAMFVSHGTQDRTLPISRTSDEIVANLQAEGYDVTFERFAGGHTLPMEVTDRAVAWFLR